jgi:hypothetical protein
MAESKIEHDTEVYPECGAWLFLLQPSIAFTPVGCSLVHTHVRQWETFVWINKRYQHPGKGEKNSEGEWAISRAHLTLMVSAMLMDGREHRGWSIT